MKTHELKTTREFFRPVLFGRKTFEIRRNDRDYRVGDKLILNELLPDGSGVSGWSLTVVVSYLTDFEQQPGFVVMAIARPGLAEFVRR